MEQEKMVQADAGAPALSEKVNLPSEWLPINSAPRDGTVIDLWVVDAEYPFRKNEHRVPDASWSEEDEDWTDGNLTTLMDCGFAPTHWRPLPSPPGAQVNFSNESESDGVSLKQSNSENS